MPTARSKRGGSLDATAVMAGVAVIALAVACFVMWQAGSRVGVDGQWWKLQEPGKIKLVNAPAGGGAVMPAVRGPAAPAKK